MHLATVDRSASPAAIELPREYNAAVEFIDANLARGRSEKTAFIDATGRYTYAELCERVNRAGNALRALGAGPETRVLMCMLDGIDFPAVFWGAIKAGCVPIPINTLLTSNDYAHLLHDSRARIAVVSEALLDRFTPALAGQPHLEQVVVAGTETHGNAPEAAAAGISPRPRAATATGTAEPLRLADLLAAARPDLDAAPTTCDDVAFWLYTSGSTGTPKGSMHLHRDLITTAEHYGVATLGIREDDVVYSAAKLFFAYGLGNGMTFPFYVGATTVVLAGRPTPDAVMALLREHRPTISSTVFRPSTARCSPNHTAAAQARAARPAGGTPVRPGMCHRPVGAGTAGRDCASPSPPARRCRRRSAPHGRSASAPPFSTGSARPRCCTSFSPTAGAMCATARREPRCPATG